MATNPRAVLSFELESAFQDEPFVPDLDSYFARIGYSGSRAPTLDTLSAIQRLHTYACTFENLDIVAIPRPATVPLHGEFSGGVSSRMMRGMRFLELRPIVSKRGCVCSHC
jgi:hypothetical protein